MKNYFRRRRFKRDSAKPANGTAPHASLLERPLPGAWPAQPEPSSPSSVDASLAAELPASAIAPASVVGAPASTLADDPASTPPLAPASAPLVGVIGTASSL